MQKPVVIWICGYITCNAVAFFVKRYRDGLCGWNRADWEVGFLEEPFVRIVGFTLWPLGILAALLAGPYWAVWRFPAWLGERARKRRH